MLSDAGTGPPQPGNHFNAHRSRARQCPMAGNSSASLLPAVWTADEGFIVLVPGRLEDPLAIYNTSSF